MTAIVQNSDNLLRKMKTDCVYTFYDLRNICDYSETELCFAILYMIKNGKIRQYRNDDVVYELI